LFEDFLGGRFLKVQTRISVPAVLLSLALVAGMFPMAAQAQVSGPDCARAGVDDRCEAWITQFDDNESAETASESPADVVVSPDSTTVYSALRTTVGSGWDATSRWTILAHDGAGRQKWLARWGDPGHYSFPTSITVSPDGRLVFVSGSWRTDQVAADGHLTTLAFDSGSGDVVWSANYDGPGNGTDNARELVVSPDGSTLYIAGISAGRDNADLDYAVIAYDTTSGAELWVSRWDGIGQGNSDSPFAIDINSGGDMLYLTGWSYGEGEYNNDYGTIAVDAAGEGAGTIVWSARYDGVGVHAPDQASALVVSPDDATVFVTGMSDDVEGGPPFDVNYGYATVAYDAFSGEQLWESRKQWPGTTFNSPNSMTIDPDGRRLVITGQVGNRELDFGTVAYDPRTGEEAWSDQYGLDAYDFELGKEVVIDPRGDTAFVTGISAKSPPGIPGVVLYAPNADALTIAYDITTGEKKWLARFNPSVTDYVSVRSMTVSPDASKIVVAASIDDQNWDYDGDDLDAVLIAYEIGSPLPPLPPPATLAFTEGSDIRGQYSDLTSIETRLTDASGEPLAGSEVRFEFQDEVNVAVTDAQGVASITTTLDQSPGEYPVTVAYAGDEEHGPSTIQGTFTIDLEGTHLLLEADRKARTLRAVLQDEDSSAGISGREVVFFYRDQVLGRATTDGSGAAFLENVDEAVRSSKHLSAVFEGDGFYLPARTD
jgi:hypothetical protein